MENNVPRIRRDTATPAALLARARGPVVDRAIDRRVALRREAARGESVTCILLNNAHPSLISERLAQLDGAAYVARASTHDTCQRPFGSPRDRDFAIESESGDDMMLVSGRAEYGT